jgi:hypothetical protein
MTAGMFHVTNLTTPGSDNPISRQTDLGGDDDMADNTQKLVSAVQSLPELQERKKVGLSLPGVRLVTWNIRGVIRGAIWGAIGWCFDCKITL